MIKKDRTAMTDPLTTGQKIVAWWETSTSASEPADLADKIDGEIDRLELAIKSEQDGAKRLRGELASLQEDFNIYARDICEPLKEENKKLRAALRLIVNMTVEEDETRRIAKEALGDE